MSLRAVAQVLAVLPQVERLRRSGDATRAIRWARRRGSARPSPADREGLIAAIHRVDARWPSGGNCWRRVLLRVALDPAAAKERVFLGFDVSGEEAPGHAWLGDDRGRPEPYLVEFEV